MDVDDVCAILGVSKTYAYSLMREYNKELKAKGYIVVAGKISTKFLAEKIYGMKSRISNGGLQRRKKLESTGLLQRLAGKPKKKTEKRIQDQG